jgi:membrane protein DedA with SNARE-associated domain
MPVYVGIHTITLAFCLPYAVFFEAGASLLFGFLPAVLCVFSAKLLGASLSFWIGRYFKMSSFVYSFLLGLFPDRIFLQFYQLDPIVYSLVSFVLGKY